MRAVSAFCIGMACFLWPAGVSTQDLPKLDHVLLRVRDHISEFERTLPDFVCDETITSRELMGGRVQHETVIDSTFMGRQRKVETGVPFTESREIRTVDGRAAAKGQQLVAPFLFGGGFSSILHEIFARENAPYFHYKIIGTEKFEGRAAVIVRLETRHGQKRLLYREMFGSQVVLKGRGRAWIDLESMNVLRLELQYLDPPSPEGELSVSVDYAPVAINGKTFWMPRKVTAEQTISNPKMPVGGQYVADYSNYHQFNVSVHFQYE